MSMFAILAAAAVSAPAVSFDCLLNDAYSVGEHDGKIVANPISFGGGVGELDWKFELQQTDRVGEIVWPESPMQLAGKGSLIQTGPTSYSFFVVSKGPCLFTEGHCGSLINFAKQTDGSLTILLNPIALTYFKETKERAPFNVFLNGHCVAKESQK